MASTTVAGHVLFLASCLLSAGVHAQSGDGLLVDPRFEGLTPTGTRGAGEYLGGHSNGWYVLNAGCYLYWALDQADGQCPHLDNATLQQSFGSISGCEYSVSFMAVGSEKAETYRHATVWMDNGRIIGSGPSGTLATFDTGLVNGSWLWPDQPYRFEFTAIGNTTTVSIAGFSRVPVDTVLVFEIGPSVDNDDGASNVTSTAATLNGRILHRGRAPCDARVYYGTSDGGTNVTAWATNLTAGTGLSRTNFSVLADGLFPDTTYYYRCNITNAGLQDAWASNSATLLTPAADGQGNVWIEATDPAAAEEGQTPGSLTVHRPPSATNAPLTISYTISGNASNGFDYQLITDTVIIPTGSSTGTIAIIPIDDGVFREGMETVTVTLAACGYLPIAASNSASVTIEDNDLSWDWWPYRMKITTRGYVASGILTNFPLLVNFRENIEYSGFSYNMLASPGGADLWFANSNMTLGLNYEVEKWDTNGESLVWVQMPVLAGSNDYIWAVFGRTGVTARACTTNGQTWSDEFKGVWHHHRTNAPDATVRGHDGTAVGNVASASGRIGYANTVHYDSAYVDVPPSGDFALGTNYTVSAWLNLTDHDADWECFGTYSRGFIFAISGANKLSFYADCGDDWRDSGVTVGQNVWTHLSYIQQGYAYRFMIDGTTVATGTRSGRVEHSNRLNMGGSPDWTGYRIDGMIDEVRLEGISRSSDWLWACWSNQCANSTFIWHGVVRHGTIMIIK